MCITWLVLMGWAFVVVHYIVTYLCFVWRCPFLYQNGVVCELWYVVLHVQEGLLNVTWHTQTPFLYSLILCTRCTSYRIVSYENWFPVPSYTFQKFSILPLAIQTVQNNIWSPTRKNVLINLTRRWRHTKQGFVTTYCITHKDRPMSTVHTAINRL
jgi:hypothetical protein